MSNCGGTWVHDGWQMAGGEGCRLGFSCVLVRCNEQGMAYVRVVFTSKKSYGICGKLEGEKHGLRGLTQNRAWDGATMVFCLIFMLAGEPVY